jgi:hypothetical protein
MAYYLISYDQLDEAQHAERVTVTPSKESIMIARSARGQ